MGLRINTNVASLRAQTALKRTTAKLEQSLTRLSTGLRINSGRDNVVGLVKSEELRSRIRGIDVALTNISNASSFFGVAEGYLSQLTEIAQDMREISVQAAESTISSADRQTLSDQFDVLLDEYTRLVTGADYAGVSILDGTFTNKTIQVGANEGETLDISIADTRSSLIGRVANFTSITFTAVSGNATAADASFADPAGNLSFDINGQTYTVNSGDYTSDGVSSVDADESALAYVNAINRIAGDSGITATVNANVFTINYSVSEGLESQIHMIINGVTVKDSTLSVSVQDDADASALVSLINDNAATTGVEATLNTSDDQIVLTASDGRNIHIQFSTDTASTSSYNVFGITGARTNTQVAVRGTFDLQSESGFTVNDATAGTQIASSASESVNVDATTALSYADLSNTTNAASAITILDNVLSQLQGRRAEVGSTAGRLDLALAELESRKENITSAESVIRDADIAVETARLTQDQILQQAGVTVLAQANAAPQIAIALLSNL